MSDLAENMLRYLGEVLGDRPRFKPWSAAALPLHLRERYRLFRTKLFGREWILALESEGWDGGSPTEYRRQAEQIQQACGEAVVLALSSVPATVRNRMVQMNVPFLVPGTQIFLPLCVVNLQERQGNRQPTGGKPLSPTAQVMLLRHILCGGLDTIPSKQIARSLGYSEMAVVKARSELEANRLCTSRRCGKEIRLECNFPPQQLWEIALPFLRTPVIRRHWCRFTAPLTGAKVAGISALANRGSVADDAIPTLALQKKRFQSLQEQGVIQDLPHREGANSRIEVWAYDPSLLSDGQSIDPLSLFLSVRDDPDERVQSELSLLMEKMPWR